VSPILEDQTLYGRLAARADLGRFKASIGSTDALGGEYLVETVATGTGTCTDGIKVQNVVVLVE
jgi:hypothetical protein